ncbi:speedy protein E4-like [Heterocephalus glaber]|uniref:Speedy protein E4-like n=1 Tax=Heterocephalus glaber TaxID=10181 RepID=A0AAX6QWP0_HETGA|nr:speedy protein E4-like [Heterocephalus glaber]
MHTSVVEKPCGLKRKKRKHLSSVLPEHHEAFTKLLEDPVIQGFLAWDINLKASDKNFLATVIAHFSWAGLFPWQFQRIHFFLALYPANNMAQDNQEPKLHTFFFPYGTNFHKIPQFQKVHSQFTRCMDWKLRVTERSVRRSSLQPTLCSGCGAEIAPSPRDPGALRTSASKKWPGSNEAESPQLTPQSQRAHGGTMGDESSSGTKIPVN